MGSTTLNSGVAEGGSFSAEPARLAVQGFLFDMDGTIVNSTAAIEKHWRRYVALLFRLYNLSIGCTKMFPPVRDFWGGDNDTKLPLMT